MIILIVLQLLIILLSYLVGSILVYVLINCLLVSIYFVPFLRFNVFAKPVYLYLSKYLPKISATEYESLVAGDVWLGKEVFQIKPNWQKICNHEFSELSNEEIGYIKTVAHQLCKISDDWEIDQEHSINDKIYTFIKENKLWGLTIPKKYGGLEFSTLAQSKIVSLIASKSINVAIIVMVPNSIGPAELILKYGTSLQKDKYLPKLAVGNEIPCFGLTSIVAGSDASSISDNGIICYDEYKGKKILGIKLNFNKRYITLAPIATLASIAVKLYDPDRLYSSREDLGITLCLIPVDAPGIKRTRHFPMNLYFPNGGIEGKDIFIPMESVIGGRQYVGRGWQMLMECLSFGRAVSLPALSVGTSQKCLLTTANYSLVREQFNLPIARFEGVQEKLARIAGLTYIIDAVNIITTNARGLNISPSVESAISKYHLTEMGRIIINDSMDILGGKAIQFGPNNFIGFTYQSLPISITVEGANILTRNLIIFSQGIMKFHPYLLQEIKCLSKKNKKNILLFENILSKHCIRIGVLLVKNLYYNILNLICWGLPKDCKYKFKMNYFSNSLSLLTEFVLVYFGKNFKTKEKIIANLSDILSYIYISYTVISYSNKNSKMGDNNLFLWSIEYLQFKILDSFKCVFSLIPNIFFSKILKLMFFPFGINLHKKYLHFDLKVVNDIACNDQLRDNLSRSCYRGDDTSYINVIDSAMKKTPIVKDIFKKLSIHGIKRSQIRTLEQIKELEKKEHFMNILSAEEINDLKEYTILVEQVIQVDHFNNNFKE
ncbi:MAG: acyl-CoA dehydrogenase [Legionellales bacterium]|nr:acyl-CoA dehydrogenase [Legionellales bacterium]